VPVRDAYMSKVRGCMRSIHLWKLLHFGACRHACMSQTCVVRRCLTPSSRGAWFCSFDSLCTDAPSACTSPCFLVKSECAAQVRESQGAAVHRLWSLGVRAARTGRQRGSVTGLSPAHRRCTADQRGDGGVSGPRAAHQHGGGHPGGREGGRHRDAARVRRPAAGAERREVSVTAVSITVVNQAITARRAKRSKR
jgi:hypothetical protein